MLRSLLRVVTSLKLLLVAAPVTARHRHQGAGGHACPHLRHHRDHQEGGDDPHPGAIRHPWHGEEMYRVVPSNLICNFPRSSSWPQHR